MGFFQLLVEMRGSVVPAIMPKIIFSAVLGVFANLVLTLDLFGRKTDSIMALELGPFAALGVAISLFLGFHNNASYARWWEARTYWGGEVFEVRNLARFLVGTMNTDGDSDFAETSTDSDRDNEQIIEPKARFSRADTAATFASSMLSSIDMDDQFDDIEANMNSNSKKGSKFDKSVARNDPKNNSYSSWQAHIVCLAIAHAHAFRSQMRPSCKMDGSVSAAQDRDRFLNVQEQKSIIHSKNPANTILLIASKILGRAHRSREIDTYSMLHVQKILDEMCVFQASCERIQNTSLPVTYSLLVHRTSVMYTFLVPFAIAPAVGWWTPLFTAIVAYTFFGLDQLAKEIQEPMRDAPMCIALSAMCRTIEIDALEALGEETPAYFKPKGNTCIM